MTKPIVDREALIMKASKAVANLMRHGKLGPKECATAALEAINAFAADREQVAQTLREVQVFNQELVAGLNEAIMALRKNREQALAARLERLIDRAEGHQSNVAMLQTRAKTRRAPRTVLR